MLNSTPNAKKLSLYCLMLVILFILPAGSAYAAWPEVEKLLASDGGFSDCFGWSVSVSGDYAVIGARGDDDNGSNSGSAYIFKRDGTSWSEQAKLTASDGTSSDQFGYLVSISGDYAIVVAKYADGNEPASGAAYIFKRDGTSWFEQAKLFASDGTSSDSFGKSVSISGDYAIVGNFWDDGLNNISGSAYIFKRDGTSWSEQAKLTASDGFVDDSFGGSVSISGDYAIVGAAYSYGNESFSGSAYIFKRSGTNWYEQAKLTASDGAAGDIFGNSVSISGDYVVVAARYADGNEPGSGAAYIFKQYGTGWYEQAKLTPSDGVVDDYFGSSVSISGDYAVVGAYGDDANGSLSGSAYIFKRDGTSWFEQAKLLASDGAVDDWFGLSVSISSGDYAIVGAYRNDDNGNQSGSAYIYGGFPEIQGTKWHDTDADFVEDADEEPIEGWRIYIDENENGQFDAGEPNDITDANGNYVLSDPVGTHLVAEEASSCWEQTYPGGDGTYSVTLEAGDVAAGYNFGNARHTEIHPSAFKQDQQDKLLAADGADNDRFGESVSVSGDYAIVGAYYDDDDGTNSGSAYIFTPNDANCSDWDWDQVAKLTAADGAADDAFGWSVSVSGDYVIVGAYLDDDSGTDSGSAYIFTPNDVDPNNWDQVAKLLPADGAGSDWFGSSVSISGDYAIVGAYKDDDNGSSSGSAYIFERSGTIWSQQAKLTAADGNAFDWFGISVSISGDYAVVGASLNDDSGSASGSAYIFQRSGTNWFQQDKLTATDAAAYDRFGYSVSVSGDYAIVGAYADDDSGTDSGSAYIFKRYGTSWSQQDKLTAADAAAGDYFGNSVSISGDYAIVGAWYDDDSFTDSGSAYIFKRDGTTWPQQAKLTASDAAAYDRFGNSVSISGDYAIVGAYGNDDSGTDSGSAYMFGKVLCPSADLTGDCFVNFYDLGRLAAEWLQGAE